MQEDAQSSALASRARPPTHKNHMSTIGRADQSQKPHVTKNHKATHTRTTKDPQRPKTRKVACRAVLQGIRHAKTTRTTWPRGSLWSCGYLGGYSPYFYIILYIYKSECECECECPHVVAVFVVFVDLFRKPLILLTFLDFWLVDHVWFLRVVLWSCGFCCGFWIARSALRVRNGKIRKGFDD